MTASRNIFRLYFTIDDNYALKNFANTISSQPFWYSVKDFKTLDSSLATEFDSAPHAINIMTKHASREPMTHLMLEFYNYTVEVRRLTSPAWTSMSLYNQLNKLYEL